MLKARNVLLLILLGVFLVFPISKRQETFATEPTHYSEGIYVSYGGGNLSQARKLIRYYLKGNLNSLKHYKKKPLNTYGLLASASETISYAFEGECLFGDALFYEELFKYNKTIRDRIPGLLLELDTAVKPIKNLKEIKKHLNALLEKLFLMEIAARETFKIEPIAELDKLIDDYANLLKIKKADVIKEADKLTHSWRRNKPYWLSSIARAEERAERHKENMKAWEKIKEKKKQEAEKKEKEIARKNAPYTRDPIIYALAGIIILLLGFRFQQKFKRPK